MVRYKSYYVISQTKETKHLLRQKSLIYIRRCARLPIHSSTQTRGKTTQLTIPLIEYLVKKHIYSRGKMILRVLKKRTSARWPNNLIGEILFSIFKTKRQLERAEKKQKSQCFKIVQIHPALGKINANICINKNLLKVNSQSFDAIVLSKCFLAFQLMQLAFVTLPNLAKFLKKILQ